MPATKTCKQITANALTWIFCLIVRTVLFFTWMQVTPSELAEIMRGLGDKLSDDEINLLVKVADKDGDGTISIDE